MTTTATTPATIPPAAPDSMIGAARITMRDQSGAGDHLGEVERKLGLLETLWDSGFVRKAMLLVLLGVIWEIYGRALQNPLLFPTLSETFDSMRDGVVSGVLPMRAWSSIKVLLMGYVAGVLLAAILTIAAINTRLGTDFLETMTAMFSPLPAIALLPLALLWFGLGRGSLIFVIVHSVLWPLALNTYAGFRGVPETLRMAGRNYGLRGLRLVLQILVPAALPAILSGLKIAWAFAWRTLIAAELVFGATSGKGGLGWYIFQNRNELYTDKVFAGLALVILIGLLVENVVFRSLERVTVQRWGMQR